MTALNLTQERAEFNKFASENTGDNKLLSPGVNWETSPFYFKIFQAGLRAALAQSPAPGLIPQLMCDWKMGAKTGDDVCVELFKHFSSEPDIGRFDLMADLRSIDRAMQHMGDQINNIDAIEEGDLEIVSLGFKAMARLLAVPPSTPVSAEWLEDAQEVAEAVAIEVLHHIDSMYPAMWTAVAKNARISIRNTIINQSKRYVAAIAAADKGCA